MIIGIQQGIEQGMKRGLEQDAYQKALETAKLIKQSNCGLDFIMQMTRLSKKEIEAL